MVDRLQVLLYRAAGHNLSARRPASHLTKVVGAIGMRDAQGSGVLSLHARLRGFRAKQRDDARNQGRLVEVCSARGVMTLVPAEHVAVFTIGTLPSDEASLRARLKPFLPDLDRSGHSATQAVSLAIQVARDALARGSLDIGGLSGALTRALPELSPLCRGRCHVAHIEQGLFDLVGESGVWRVERIDGERMSVGMEEPQDRALARAELARRYLRCYGPSTAKHFAEWCGISVADARNALVTDRTVEVAKGSFLLADELDRFNAPPEARGVRIIPPRDPYLLGRDRATLVPNRDVQKTVWRATPIDGLVLADGEPVATWRPNKSGTVLRLQVRPFVMLTDSTTDELEQEAMGVAMLRGCETAELVLTSRAGAPT